MPVWRFAEFRLDSSAFELRSDKGPVRLEQNPLNLLILLVENHGRLVERQQIVQKLWGSDVFVDTDLGINTAIRKIRLTLNDDPAEPRFVQTIVGKGYRFIADVQLEVAPAASQLVPIADGPIHDRYRSIWVAAIVLLAAMIGGYAFYGSRTRSEPRLYGSVAVLETECDRLKRELFMKTTIVS